MDDKEQSHFRKVVRAFLSYEEHTRRQLVERPLSHYQRLNTISRSLLPEFERKVTRVEEALHANQVFLSAVAQPHRLFENQDMSAFLHAEDMDRSNEIPGEADYEKVRVTLRQLVRDWTDEGQEERERCYKPQVEEVEARLPVSNGNPRKPRVLVPGSGLGRLAFEIARRGYAVQGNEFSYYMLLASEQILNRTARQEEWGIYPWVHQTSNVMHAEDMLRRVALPEINPSSGIPSDMDLSMTAGDFLEVYGSQREAWDCLVTCFFLDTAHNIIEYVRVIAQILRPGGYWINFGPLLYHYAEIETEFSIELSYDELRSVVVACGFRFLREERRRSSYTSNKRSMMQMQYECVFFTVLKESMRDTTTQERGVYSS